MERTQDNRDTMLDAIRSAGFALLETVLYLDTHPGDAAAIRYYTNMLADYREKIEKYEAAYGPLTPMMTGAPMGDSWTWTDGPWPWQDGVDMPMPSKGKRGN